MKRIPEPRYAARGLLAVVLLGIAMISLSSCGGNNVPSTSIEAAPTATTATSAAQGGAATTDPTATIPATMPEEMTATPQPDSAGSTGSLDSSSGVVGAGPTQQAAGQGAPGATEVNAVLKEWSLTLDKSEVSAGVVRFTVTNEGFMAHNLTVVGDSGEIGATPIFRGSEGPQTLEVTLQPGTYTIICSLPGHAARGQKTQLTVK